MANSLLSPMPLSRTSAVTVKLPGSTAPTKADSTSDSLNALQKRLSQLESWTQLQTSFCECDDLTSASAKLAKELQRHFACQRVAIGWRKSRHSPCRLISLSDVAKFSARSEMVRQVEAVLDECLLRESPMVWPSPTDAPVVGGHAHRQLSAAMANSKVASIPLFDTSNACRGAIVVVGGESHDAEEMKDFSEFAATSLSATLGLLDRSTTWALARLWRAIWNGKKRSRVYAALVAVALASGILSIPIPYRISADCDVQPVARRFIVAPFESSLEKALAVPGDVVKADQPLARLDGREIRLELAAIHANYSRVALERDTALANGQTSAAQIARLEMERLQLEAEVLQQRESQLEIKSPVSGILISGDLKKIEGAKLSMGQTLFEIGPLDEMIVEIAVGEADVNLVQPGSTVTLRLDAVSGQTWHGTIARIHPRSEIRDDRNVFVAEVNLKNDSGVLRPGMKGTAKIIGPTRSLAWNLFHKPWNEIQKWCGI